MRVSILISGLLFAGACGSDSTPTPPASHNKTVSVATIGNNFVESFVQLERGDTIRFSFTAGFDGMGHDVTFNKTPAGAPRDIPVTRQGDVSLVFTTVGTFHYNCFVHPGMSGDVVVH